MSEINLSVCFTGHREISHPDIAKRLDDLLSQLISKGYRYFRAGGALGFDTEAALSVLRLQEKYPQIELILILPYLTQASKWSAEQQDIYEKIKNRAAKITYTSQGNTRGCFHIRNRALVDEADFCIAYQTSEKGGTAYTVNYAQKKGLEITNVAKETASI